MLATRWEHQRNSTGQIAIASAATLRNEKSVASAETGPREQCDVAAFSNSEACDRDRHQCRHEYEWGDYR